MLDIRNVNVAFEHKLIFKNANFKAYTNELTVVYGKSGIGKSTLLDVVLFKYTSNYKYNNEIIDEQKQVDFLYNNISFVKQIPILIEALTIDDHIDFIQKTYSIEDLKVDILEKLRISDLLNKYPSQLSQGEKIRVALYLAVLKEPNILILDEPTASLDNANKMVVIQFLKEYAHAGHMVICASHDQMLLEVADVLYRITNNKLIKEKNSNHNDVCNVILYKKSSIDLFDVYKKMDRFKRVFRIITQIILSLSIAFVFISLSMNNAYMDQLKNSLNEFSSRELIVYKNIYPKNKFSARGIEFPLSDKDVKLIRTIKGVESVEWRFDALLDCTSTWQHTIGFSDLSKKYNEVYGYITDNKVHTFIDENIYLHTYIDKVDYSMNVEKMFNEEGVYISSSLYKKLFDVESNMVNPHLEFYLMIPQFNSSGISYEINPEYEGDSLDEAPANHVSCKPVKVTMPIKGVLKGSVLSQEDNSSPFHIYVSQSKMQEYIKKYNPTIQQQTIYWISKDNKNYLNTLPTGYSLGINDQIINQTRWQPNAYSVIVEDLSQINEVIDSLVKQGFRVDNQYFNTHSILQVEASTRNILVVVSLVLMLIILVSYFILMYLNRTSNKNTNEYLRYLGYDLKFISHFNHIGRVYRFVRLCLYSILIYLVIRFVLETSHIAYIKLNIKIFIGMILVSFIAEYVYPYILQRGLKND